MACAATPRRLQAEQRGEDETTAIPPIVNEVLRMPGQPLDPGTRAFMEPRFGHDLSRVRIHSDAAAAESARAVHADAYAFATHVVLGHDQAPMRSGAGARLLAHELAHTVQQAGCSASSLPERISDPDEASEREAHAWAERIVSEPAVQPHALAPTGPRLSRVPMQQAQTPARGSLPVGPSSSAPRPFPATRMLDPGPAHGPNPADCLASPCAAASAAPAPANTADKLRRVDDWESQSLACIRANAAASNASHAAAIQANEESEITADASALRTRVRQAGPGAAGPASFLDDLHTMCARKTQEVRIEFHFNVAFDNTGTSSRWGAGASGEDWDSIEQALSALPPQATWSNPRLVVFGRAACHPEDLNAQGVCAGHSMPGQGTGFIGGEADSSTGRITVYDRGLGSAPYGRSSNLGLPATQQTLRHEVGHLAEAQVPPAELKTFFEVLLKWQDYAWAWITSPAPRSPNWQAERDSLRAELGLEEAQLDAWLATLQPNQSVTVGQRTYTRDAAGSGGSTLFLHAIDPSRIPRGVEFSYARTSQGEYFAELYALAVSRPAFLSDALPAPQSEWLRRIVFGTPATANEWASRIAARDDATLIERLLRTYTWTQADAVLNEHLGRRRAGGQAA
ncbi:hypothetical protein A8M77_31135 [Variovorax sp. JS1663]|nr:hypothetical protein A8M77_31135 [Variovorax sp. JS1663]